MQNMLDVFAAEVRKRRKQIGISQKDLAHKLNMCERTIIDLENCKSNPKCETVFLIARELNISLDAILFPDLTTRSVSKSVIDFFEGKSESEIQNYISLCRQADQFKISK